MGIALHNACENAEILQEIIAPAIIFGQNDISEEIPDLSDIVPRTAALETSLAKDAITATHSAKIQQGITMEENRSTAVALRFSTGGGAWFPWKTISFLLLISTAAIINLDLERSGGKFKGSNTGQFLADIGQYDRVVASSNWIVATTKQGQVWAEVQTRHGREWAEVTLPVYWLQTKKVTGPYLAVAGAKAAEVVEVVTSAVRTGLASAEAAVPGLQDWLTQARDLLVKWGGELVVRAKGAGIGIKEGVLRLVSGKVDWSAVKLEFEEGLTRTQEYLVSLFNYVRVQVQHLVK